MSYGLQHFVTNSYDTCILLLRDTEMGGQRIHNVYISTHNLKRLQSQIITRKWHDQSECSLTFRTDIYVCVHIYICYFLYVYLFCNRAPWKNSLTEWSTLYKYIWSKKNKKNI